MYVNKDPHILNKYFFDNPINSTQKRYESLRASYVDNLSDKKIAERYNYSLYSFKSIKRDAKKWVASNLFRPIQKGRPKGKDKKTIASKDRIIKLRKRVDYKSD